MDMALTRLKTSRDAEGDYSGDDSHGEGHHGPGNGQDSPRYRGQHLEEPEEHRSNLLVTSTVSVPEVSLVPSPEVSKVHVS